MKINPSLTEQNHYRYRFETAGLIFILCLTAGLVLFSAPVLAEETSGLGQKSFEIRELQVRELTVLDQQKKKRRRKPALNEETRLKRLQSGIEKQKAKVLKSKVKEKNLLTELEKIDHRLFKQRTTLNALNRKYSDQELQIKSKQKDIVRVTADKEAIKAHVKNRLAAYYRMGSIGLMNVVFSTKTLPELLSFQEYFHQLLQYDQAAIDSYLSKIDELNRARKAHALEKKRLIIMVGKVKKEKKRLDAAQADKSELLDRVNTEKGLYEQAVAEIEEAASNLSKTLDDLKEQPEPVEAPAIKTYPEVTRPGVAVVPVRTVVKPGQKFVDLKGRLQPPVYGTIVTTFGRRKKGKFGIDIFTNGIDIKADPGSDIRAVFDGKIIHSGYLRGYGNLIIIDHGQQYYTLISRIGELKKKEGASVRMGDIIGIMGDNMALLGEGLHFEVRRGSTPENPLSWLNNASLTFMTHK